MKHPAPCLYDDSIGATSPETDFCTCPRRPCATDLISQVIQLERERCCLLMERVVLVYQLDPKLPLHALTALRTAYEDIAKGRALDVKSEMSKVLSELAELQAKYKAKRPYAGEHTYESVLERNEELRRDLGATRDSNDRLRSRLMEWVGFIVPPVEEMRGKGELELSENAQLAAAVLFVLRVTDSKFENPEYLRLIARGMLEYAFWMDSKKS